MVNVTPITSNSITERFIQATCDLIGDDEPKRFLDNRDEFFLAWDQEGKSITEIESYLNRSFPKKSSRFSMSAAI